MAASRRLGRSLNGISGRKRHGGDMEVGSR